MQHYSRKAPSRSRAISIGALAVFLMAPAAQACTGPLADLGLFARSDLHFELLLTNDRRVRPEGIAPFPAGHDGPVRAEAARRELGLFLEGKALRGPQQLPAPDRWGRVTARLQTGAGQDLTAWLASAGLVRIAPGEWSCTRLLLEAEEKARKAKLGLWADPYYSLLAAGDHAALRARSGEFVIVEGRIMRLGQTSARFYLDFGPVRGVDLSVTFNKQSAKAFSADMSPEKLVGRLVLVRGTLEHRPGPQIEIAGPAALQNIGR